MPIWEYFHKPPPRQRNLQEGLFQIASQTCSLLVQVNNTNNITFGDHASNINCSNIHNGAARVDVEDIAKAATSGFANGGFAAKQQQDAEQLVVLLPHKNRLHRQGSTLRKPRLSWFPTGGPPSVVFFRGPQLTLPRAKAFLKGPQLS